MSDDQVPTGESADVLRERMRADWNERAKEDAGYYVAFGARDQSEAEFFATAKEIAHSIEMELRRVPAVERKALRVLEIGCGPGRLMRPLAPLVGEIHGVDISDAMIGLALENLKDVPNAFAHVSSGATLSSFPDQSFDFVYSYAVFQHIPSRAVVLSYLKEARRVLKPGGWLRAQFNGLPDVGSSYNTWAGARFSAPELMEFARANNFQVLVLEGASTQYLWVTWRKRPRGWFEQIESAPPPESGVRIRRVSNAQTMEPVVPSRGRFAAISIRLEGLPEECGLHHLQITIGGAHGTPTYIGPADNTGLQQVNVILPPLESTGLLPVEMFWMGRTLAPPAALRVIPPGPLVPRLVSVTDAVNLCSTRRIETGLVKVTLEDVSHPDDFLATVDGHPGVDLEFLCTDPRLQKFEVNFRLPEEITPGIHTLEIKLGRRRFAPVPIDVVARS
jgi:ubiquinone/menaquinone biosynthesis C-methylase UbiE